MMTYYFINPAPGVVCLYLDGCLVMKCWLDLVAEFGEVKISVGYVLWMCWSFSQVGHTSVEPVDPNKQKVIQWTYTWFTFYSIIFYFIIFLYLQQFRSSGDFLNRDTLVQIFTGYNAACWTLPSRFGRIHVFIFDWKRVLWERFTTACALCFCYESPWVFGCALSSRQTFLNQSGWLQIHPVRMPVLSKCSVRPCAQARPRKEFAAGHAVDMTVVTCCE